MRAVGFEAETFRMAVYWSYLGYGYSLVLQCMKPICWQNLLPICGMNFNIHIVINYFITFLLTWHTARLIFNILHEDQFQRAHDRVFDSDPVDLNTLKLDEYIEPNMKAFYYTYFLAKILNFIHIYKMICNIHHTSCWVSTIRVSLYFNKNTYSRNNILLTGIFLRV